MPARDVHVGREETAVSKAIAAYLSAGAGESSRVPRRKAVSSVLKDMAPEGHCSDVS